MPSKHPRRLLASRLMVDLIEDSKGGTVIEYALIAALIAIALIGALGSVRDALIGLPMGTILNAFASALS